ncbi:uncharacterized protein LOC110367214 [Fundulus heteroclitus]|uniref:uncharacterized protein LOC110367214 n=1 Tax=Fundulus heteroclitus TaxID=8078 RepID=UPI00079EED1D|nr:uncharacterized protein LOC110367214 [Fundulus heteroclitus]
MPAAVGLLLLLLGVSQGLHVHCDGRNNGTRCNLTVGDTLFLQLVGNASGIRIHLKKERSTLLRWIINRIVINSIENRSVFIPTNGTFKISEVEESDNGDYKLEINNSNGILNGTANLHLSVKDSSSWKTGVIAAVFCVVSLCIISLIVIYALRKKQKSKEEEDLTDLTYAVVITVAEPARRPVMKKVEEEVEYGQIKSES